MIRSFSNFETKIFSKIEKIYSARLIDTGCNDAVYNIFISESSEHLCDFQGMETMSFHDAWKWPTCWL